MRDFTIDNIKEFVAQSLDAPPTGNAMVDALYDSVIPITGHTNPYYRLFYRLSKELQPKSVVELGSWRGIGAAHFAAGCDATRVYTIDIHREDKEAQAIVRHIDSEMPNLAYLNGWTWDPDIVDMVRQYAAPIDILFIDAWHEYKYAMPEWRLYGPLLADPALVIADDLFDAAGATVEMVRFWKELTDGLEDHCFIDTSLHSGVQMGYLEYRYAYE